MNAAKDNDIRLGGGCLLGKTEGIADEISHVLNLWDLIIVGENDGVELAF